MFRSEIRVGAAWTAGYGAPAALMAAALTPAIWTAAILAAGCVVAGCVVAGCVGERPSPAASDGGARGPVADGGMGSTDAGPRIDGTAVGDAAANHDAAASDGVVWDAGLGDGAAPDSGVPAGWTCSAGLYGDGSCNCGCGVLDEPDCDVPLDYYDCPAAYDGCEDGFGPDPADPRRCAPVPGGWTCSWFRLANRRCDCGCGIADPDCPAVARVSDCRDDGCGSGMGPDPRDLTQCMAAAPQDHWTCDLDLLFDGAQCDCGCGAVDTDCPGGATAASCDTVHCGSGQELIAGQIAECQISCTPRPDIPGVATCTNGGSFSVGSACTRSLSRCTDGNRYEMECSGGECLCRVNGGCVRRLAGSGCSLSACGWHLTDAT